MWIRNEKKKKKNKTYPLFEVALRGIKTNTIPLQLMRISERQAE